MNKNKKPEPKPLFLERMNKLLEGKDFEEYLEILKKEPVRSIRCNTNKISPKDLKERLEAKGWIINNPFKNNPDVMIVEGKSEENNSKDLDPGELGRSLEHVLGYYYIQELSSMLPIIALNPKEGETVLDLCASPGSKTTQIASYTKNNGTIIANEVSIGRIKILASNLERCGVSSAMITKQDGAVLCKRLKEQGIRFDKILVDAPCSGEGTLRSSPKTYKMWNIKTVKNLPKIQLRLFKNAFEVLKEGGEIVYSTCTHAPEENEGIVNSILKELGDEIEIEKINLPIKCRQGIQEWQEEEYKEETKYSCRIYPHDANTEGFFIAKFRKVKK